MTMNRWEALLNRNKHVPINNELVGESCDYCWRPSHIECQKCLKRLCGVHLSKECSPRKDIRRRKL